MPGEPIEGALRFGPDATRFEGATLELIVEDTTYADARAVIVERRVVRSVAFDGTPGGTIPFQVPRPPAEPGRRHTLRVLLDLDGDGRLGPGDYRNAESVPLPPPGSGERLEVRITRVR